MHRYNRKRECKIKPVHALDVQLLGQRAELEDRVSSSNTEEASAQRAVEGLHGLFKLKPAHTLKEKQGITDILSRREATKWFKETCSERGNRVVM
jgi:hypothetical protein